MDKVDILLPIYNSVEETKNCIQSIFANTKEEHFNLYLLDDRSPDHNIPELTSYYSQKYKNVIAIRNDENLGFPGNVNNGFSVSSNDVVIINSDTLVTEGWLENLWKTAYSEEAIAAVNPMSNYGIVSGVPTTNNAINDLFSFEELSEAYKVSKGTGYVEAPVLIGFCMYVKRLALQSVGVFDAATFKRGYGEETDWCLRARKQGFKLVVSEDVYVHHIGGSSFGAEKEQLRKKSREILLKRYPEIDGELRGFVKTNHFKEMRRRMINNLPFFQKRTSFVLKMKMIKHFMANYI